MPVLAHAARTNPGVGEAPRLELDAEPVLHLGLVHHRQVPPEHPPTVPVGNRVLS